MTSFVTETPPARSTSAAAHFAGLLAFETDCLDVHESMVNGADFILVQSNSTPEGFAACHIPGAVHIPHAEMTEERMAEFPPDTVFVVYCNGPHCKRRRQGRAPLGPAGPPGQEDDRRHRRLEG